MILCHFIISPEDNVTCLIKNLHPKHYCLIFGDHISCKKDKMLLESEEKVISTYKKNYYKGRNYWKL